MAFYDVFLSSFLKIPDSENNVRGTNNGVDTVGGTGP